MDLTEFQRLARVTDQYPGESGSDRFEVGRHEVIPMLGLVGEVGGLLGEYKKLLRDGATHRKFHDEVAEELGDLAAGRPGTHSPITLTTMMAIGITMRCTSPSLHVWDGRLPMANVKSPPVAKKSPHP